MEGARLLGQQARAVVTPNHAPPGGHAAVLDDLFGPEPVPTEDPAAIALRAFLASGGPTNRVRASRAVARAPILRKADRRALLDIRRRARIRTFEPGAVMAGETSGTERPSLRDGDVVHVIVSGWCKAVRSHPDGSRVVVDIRGPGEIAGLERYAAVWGPSHTAVLGALAGWVALGPVEAVPILAVAVRWAVECSPPAVAEAQWFLGQRVVELEGQALLGLRSTDERLMRTLRSLALRYGVRAGEFRTVEVPLTQGDVAALIGATRETTNRALRRLAARGDVVLDEGRAVLVRTAIRGANVPA
jgi:CRP-like cAMP-binding protein